MDRGRGLHEETSQSALAVILKWVILKVDVDETKSVPLCLWCGDPYDVRQFWVGRNEWSSRAAIIFLYPKIWTWCMGWPGFRLSRKTSQDVASILGFWSNRCESKCQQLSRGHGGKEQGAQAASQPGTVSRCLLFMPQIMPAMDWIMSPLQIHLLKLQLSVWLFLEIRSLGEN